MKSFIRGVIIGVIIAYVIARIANIGYTENEKVIRNSLGDAADFAAYCHDSGDETAMDSCLIKRKQAYDLGYRGWY